MFYFILFISFYLILYASNSYEYTNTDNRYLQEIEKPFLIKGPGRSIYLVENNIKRLIPDWETFVALNYDINQVQTLSELEYDAINEGEELPSILKKVNVDESISICPCQSSSRNITENKHIKNIICFLDNDISYFFFLTHSNESLRIHYDIISSLSNNNSHCTVIINLIRMQAFSESQCKQKYICPEQCMPIPYTEIPVNWLTEDPNLNTNALLTCSLKMSDIIKGTNTSLTHDGIGSIHIEKYHSVVGYLLRQITKRRIEECFEREFWRHHDHNFHKSHLHENQIETVDHVLRRKVFGLIIWVGSTSRYSLLRQQIEVLRRQPSYDDDKYIAGWLASEDQYPCRLGTTLCYSADPYLYYFSNMPKTRMNVAPAGWACAQRRPLRALSHVLLLYNPEFVLLVDDDTLVNIKMLYPGMPLVDFINNEMKMEPLLMGQLTGGKKVTRHGFYYGGAGYLLGKMVLSRLSAFQIISPPTPEDAHRDKYQSEALGLLSQVVSLANSSCHSECIQFASTSTNIAKTTVRLIEICSNLMAEEHTCYHSDHSLSRCLVHGVYATPLDIQCYGVQLKPNLMVGMCMGIDECVLDSNVLLTCHRWMPSSTNISVPVALKWNDSNSKYEIMSHSLCFTK